MDDIQFKLFAKKIFVRSKNGVEIVKTVDIPYVIKLNRQDFQLCSDLMYQTIQAHNVDNYVNNSEPKLEYWEKNVSEFSKTMKKVSSNLIINSDSFNFDYTIDTDRLIASLRDMKLAARLNLASGLKYYTFDIFDVIKDEKAKFIKLWENVDNLLFYNPPMFITQAILPLTVQLFILHHCVADEKDREEICANRFGSFIKNWINMGLNDKIVSPYNVLTKVFPEDALENFYQKLNKKRLKLARRHGNPRPLLYLPDVFLNWLFNKYISNMDYRKYFLEECSTFIKECLKNHTFDLNTDEIVKLEIYILFNTLFKLDKNLIFDHRTWIRIMTTCMLKNITNKDVYSITGKLIKEVQDTMAPIDCAVVASWLRNEHSVILFKMLNELEKAKKNSIDVEKVLIRNKI